MRVECAVIPAGGLGTRFLPASKSVPKTMLPILDRPMIQQAVEEIIDSGIHEVVIVVPPGDQTTEAHFSPSPALEDALAQKGEKALLEMVRRLSSQAKVSFITQEQPLGLGHAVLMAKPAVGDRPLAVLLPDDIIVGPRPALAQMLEVYDKYGGNLLAVEEVTPEEIVNYGSIDPEPVEQGVYLVKGMVEKPQADQAPSLLGIVGRYVLMPEIFDSLENTRPGAKGEIQLTDGIAGLMATQQVYAFKFQGVRYDVGNPLGALKASIALALERQDMASEIKEWLRGMLAPQ